MLIMFDELCLEAARDFRRVRRFAWNLYYLLGDNPDLPPDELEKWDEARDSLIEAVHTYRSLFRKYAKMQFAACEYRIKFFKHALAHSPVWLVDYWLEQINLTNTQQDEAFNILLELHYGDRDFLHNGMDPESLRRLRKMVLSEEEYHKIEQEEEDG